MTPQEYEQYYKDIDKAQRAPVLGGAASGAATGISTGMTIGSIIPGVGPAIGAGVGGLIGGIAGGFNAAPSVAEKENAIKLKELLRRQEMGQLGLTEEEKQRVYGEQLGATTKAAADVRAQQSGIAASLATGSGRAAIDRAMQEESVVRQRAAAQQTVSEADFKRQAAEAEEIDKRLGILNKAEVEGKKEIGKAGIQTATMAAQEIERIKNVRGAKPTPEQLAGLSAYTGLSPEQLGPALEYFASNPESASILTEILTAGSAGVAGAK